ncbi:MAG: hypothetical protein HYS87_01830 [Candidatus Colwellbacteria bacterium]|nr:hypothetical protein [Candidatus Colwellbacteria bacterium]
MTEDKIIKAFSQFKGISPDKNYALFSKNSILEARRIVPRENFANESKRLIFAMPQFTKRIFAFNKLVPSLAFAALLFAIIVSGTGLLGPKQPKIAGLNQSLVAEAKQIIETIDYKLQEEPKTEPKREESKSIDELLKEATL